MCSFPADSAPNFPPMTLTMIRSTFYVKIIHAFQTAIRANRMGQSIMQMAVHYLLKCDFCFTFLIKFSFIDFVLHLPKSSYATSYTLSCLPTRCFLVFYKNRASHTKKFPHVKHVYFVGEKHEPHILSLMAAILLYYTRDSFPPFFFVHVM